MIAGIALKLAATLTGWGLPAQLAGKVAKPLLVIGSVVAVAGLGLLIWNLWLGSHDRAVVKNHDAQVNVKTLETKAAADTAAAEEARTDDTRAGQETAELERIIANAPDSNRPLTDQRRNYLRCVRLQQQARAAGQPAPTCN